MQAIEDLQFHNAHPEPREGGILQLPRYPAEVRHKLNERGRMVAMDSCGVELRFVTEAQNIRITLSCEDADSEVLVFRGPFLHKVEWLKQGIPTAIQLEATDSFNESKESMLQSGGFSPKVWRVVTNRKAKMQGSYLFHKLETFGHAVRAPRADELPKTRWLAYGSSITHSHLAGYPFHAARLMHWDLFAKGLSGACQIDPAAADYLASLASEKNVDFITAELGVNMRHKFSVEDFGQRTNYLVNRLREAQPNAQIGLITAFTNSEHHPRETHNQLKYQQGFDQAMRQIVANNNDPKLILIEGTELLTDFTLLRSDLLHPSDSGHALMGQNLATHLGKLV
jgi:hypothetical protein